MKVFRNYLGNLIERRKTQSLYEKTLIGPKRAVFNFSNRQWGSFDYPRAYATAYMKLQFSGFITCTLAVKYILILHIVKCTNCTFKSFFTDFQVNSSFF